MHKPAGALSQLAKENYNMTIQQYVLPSQVQSQFAPYHNRFQQAGYSALQLNPPISGRTSPQGGGLAEDHRITSSYRMNFQRPQELL